MTENECKSLRGQFRAEIVGHRFVGREERTHNSTYKKLAVLWLNEDLCFVSSFVVADSFVLRNRQLLVAAKRYLQW